MKMLFLCVSMFLLTGEIVAQPQSTKTTKTTTTTVVPVTTTTTVTTTETVRVAMPETKVIVVRPRRFFGTTTVIQVK